MATLLLVRHGRTAANANGVLAGRTDGVGLDETGMKQADALATRMASLPLVAVVTSPLLRCCQTAEAIVRNLTGPGVPSTGVPSIGGPSIEIDPRLTECGYGDWTGRSLKQLARDPLWRVVQAHPSAAVFPGVGGESLRAVQSRAVDAVREHDARVAEVAGDDAVWTAVSHGDVIKAVVADALGLHLDQFQRIVADPCSVSVIHYTPVRPFVVRLNDTGGDLSTLLPRRRRRRTSRARGAAGTADAPVGGRAGTP